MGARYYRRIIDEGGEQVWRIEDRRAVLLGGSNPERGVGSYFEAAPHETIWEPIERAGWARERFFELELGPRDYYPRIARPVRYTEQRYVKSPTENYKNIIALGVGQANALMRRLDQICQAVHPAADTLNVYGHEIRNLLILASTEVEAHWRGVLDANGFKKRNLCTKNYVRLVGPMKLDSYAVSFPSYPWLEPAKPFAGWNAEQPLEWYQAYNKVKHDREDAFQRATLQNAFNAVSACVVMLAAQFTRSKGLGGHSDLSAYFQFSEIPEREAAETYSDYAEDGREWTAVQHPDLKS